MTRHLSPLDQGLAILQNSLKTLFSKTYASQRNYPAHHIAETSLSKADQTKSAGMIRVDHAGEVCAQALYQSQALFGEIQTKNYFHQAMQEEFDHLAWCQKRLDELNSHTSFLNPFWYAGAFTLGSIASIMGKKWNLAFLDETEQQVANHLERQLNTLPPQDERSRAILLAMKEDELQHAHEAQKQGAATMPRPIKWAMRAMSGVMVHVAYYI